jgi:hypothetical protein
MGAKRILAGLVAAAFLVVGGVAAVTVPAGADPAPGFSNADVGFSEGAATGGVVDRLDRMDAYVGDRKPILRLDLNWWGVQGCAGCAPDFSALDPIVDAASARGVRGR